MNDSGILFYLKALNKDNPNTKVIFTIKQDKNEVVASVTADISEAPMLARETPGMAAM